MKTTASILLVMVLACLTVRADDAGDTSDTQILGARERMFRDIGPRRSVLVGIEVYFGKIANNDVVHGIRPIFLGPQGREQFGSLHGKDTGRPPIAVKAKKGYAVGAISAVTGWGIDGLSVTFMKLDKGQLDLNQSYESEWLGGRGLNRTTRLGGSGAAVVGLVGSQNNNSELNGLGLILSNKAVAAAPQNKSPLPDEATQAKALKLAKEVYGEAWAAAKAPSQKRDLAQKFLHAADESENDPPSRYILLKLARDVATQATDGLLAFEAIDKMAEQFQVDDVEMKTNVLTAFSKRAKLQADHKALAEQAAGLIDGAIAHEKIDLAVKLCELALPEARASRDPDLLREVKARSEQCRDLAKASREMKEAAAVLDKKPDDAAANLTVGKYYCFQIGDWEKGLPMLALGQDETLKAVAGQEIAGIAKADDKVKVGDAWWDLAEKEHGKVQVTLRGRANYWYQQAMPELSGLAKAKLEKRIKEYEASIAGTEEKKTDGPAAPKRGSKYLPGLVAQYFNDTRFTLKAKARVDANLDFDWGSDSPDPAVNTQNFGAGWLGYLKAPKTGRYVIHVHSHHDSKVMIDNIMVITTKMSARSDCVQQAEVNLTAGHHLLGVQFVHGWGQADIHLGWQPPGAASWTAIPQQNLFHDLRQEQAVGIGGR